MVKQSVSSYEMFCGAGHRIEFESPVPADRDYIAVRKYCPNCGRYLYSHCPGDKCYKPREDTLRLHWAILDVFGEIAPPMTIRQVYYQLCWRHAVEKTEAGYNKTQRALTDMRRSGAIPYSWLGDNSRSIYSVAQHDSLSDALAEMHRYYRRNIWSRRDAHVEIWLEKRALVSQILPICQEYGVTLFPCGGYSSISFAYEATQSWMEHGKPVFVYHLSDFDADGAYSSVSLERELRTHSSQEIHFSRIALTADQVVEYNLGDAMRPQNPKSKRIKWWQSLHGKNGMACDLDAIHPATLRQIVRNAIESHVDIDEIVNIKRIEAAERRTLATMAKNYQKQPALS